MTATIRKFLNDSPVARWAALILIALMMFFAYMFVDVMSPLKSLIESSRGWDSGVFGTYAASEYILNVCGFLIVAGIILDKMGIRFTGVLSASLMVIGAGIKYIGISDWFQATAFCGWLDSWWTAMPGSAKMAALGFMVFGCGCEMAGTTVSKAIAKWFKGKEMALAMGLEMAIARLGVFAVMWLSPAISDKFGGSVVAPLAFCTCLLLVGLINYIVFSVMDTRLDRQLVAAGEATAEKSPEDEFHIRDLGQIFSSKMFWLVALLCVLYYSAIFPFQRYAPNFLEVTLDVDANTASRLFSCFPILAMCLTPVLGIFADGGGCHHDSMPPEFRIPAAVISVQMVRSTPDSDFRCELFPRAGSIMAERAENHRRKDTGKRLLSHLLGAEHRAVLGPSAHRSSPEFHRRISGAYDHILVIRRTGIHPEPAAQGRRQEERLRTRTAEYPE